MSDTNGAAAPASPAVGPGLALHKIYVKDVSFESPHSPAVFSEEWRPEVEINVQSRGNQVGENVFEVVLAATITAKLGEKTAFLIEVQQAGVFEVSGASGEDLKPILASTCPGVLYPYLREAVSDLVTRGGFPPLLLAPTDFRAIYAQSQGAGPPVGTG